MRGHRMIKKFLRKKRTFVQGVATFLSNIHLSNFLEGKIYKGRLKSLCLPGLNCYSCPGATLSCPIGSFQAVVGSDKYSFSYYVAGIMMLFGVLVGRLICGFLCPFGWFQDLLHKIPSKKLSTSKLKILTYLKYVIMVGVVWLMGVIFAGKYGISSPYFCKYICPQGILGAGIPLAITNPSIRNILGSLFSFKFAILVAITVLSVFFYRPFCKWICPLGAFYGLFNKVSIYRYGVDYSKCINCKKCAKACDMDVDMSKQQDSAECIRCGKCVDVCPTKAIYTSIFAENVKQNIKTKEK